MATVLEEESEEESEIEERVESDEDEDESVVTKASDSHVSLSRETLLIVM